MLETSGKFRVTAWNEQPCPDMGSGRKFTRSTVKRVYSGSLTGEGSVEYVMYYLNENESCFIGMELFEGTMAGKPGTVVLQHDGRFKDGIAMSDWIVAPGSGTGALKDIKAKGRYKTLNHDEAAYEFSFTTE